MEDILVFTAGLSESQKQYIHRFFSEKKSLPARIISLLLEGTLSKSRAASQLQTTPATFHKACTEAKQELIETVIKFIETPYDEIYLLKTLVLHGHFSQAVKYAIQLEKQSEIKQQWQQLELLYVEISRLCQATGNLKLSKEITKKRTVNADRLKTFITLSGQLNVLLFEFEVYEKKKLPKKFIADLNKILKQAEKLGHYTLIHNSLQLQYLYYSRYTNNAGRAAHWAEEIYRNRQKHKGSLNEISSVLALNAYFNYLSIYEGNINPSIITEMQKTIDVGGKHARFNFYYALLDYFLFTGKFKELDSFLKNIVLTEDNTKFAVWQQSVTALKYFAEKDYENFREYLGKFYEDASRLDFPDAECFLRIAEVLWLIHTKREDEALYKLNSLRVFIDRNLTDRYDHEREIVKFLGKLVKRTIKESERISFLNKLRNAPYLSVRFFAKIMEERLPRG